MTEAEAKKPHPRQKYDQSTVDAVRHSRFVEERSLSWISRKFDIPLDTIRDWVYRERRV
jgi:hypothetical protein